MLYRDMIVDNTYQVCEEIGAGGMGVIFLAYHIRLGKYVVMKKIKNPTAQISMLRNEVDILKSLHHQYLPQVYDFISFEGDLYTIIDYIEGYDLKYYIDNGIEVTEGQLIKWLRQLCEVLEYLHTHEPRILHTDIKPANIIVQPSGDICLIDFGISLLGDDQIKGLSYEYSSPEQNYNVTCLREHNYDYLLDLDERTDIYSLGVTFYQLITLITPSCLYELPPTLENMYYPVSEPLAKIIDKAISFDREARYNSVAEMLKAIDNMYKLGTKYKYYITVQIVSSVLACLMIISGVFIVINQLNNNRLSAFESDYNSYLSALNRNDTQTAINQAKLLLNSSQYKALMDEKTICEIYQGLGGCYFDSGDYRNASACYAKATEYAAASDSGDSICRDHALSLIEEGRIQEADTVLQELIAKYPDSASGDIIIAQLKSKEGNYTEAKQYAHNAISKAGDADTRYTAYLILGDICSKTGDTVAASDAYESAKNLSENAVILRRYGAEQLQLAAGSNNVTYYMNARKAYQRIYDDYAPTENDVFNLAQCYLMSGDVNGAQNAITMLEKYAANHPDSCLTYIMLAISADAANDAGTADYCRKAHDLFVKSSNSDKSAISSEVLDRIKALYQTYVKEAW